ncbi:MAG: hypothetical protein AB9866_21440 [Syntrophobacteraceae bacterium]
MPKEWDDAERKSVQSAFAALCELHNKTVSLGLASIYMQVLEQYTAAEAVRALEYAIRSLRFFPKPTELIDAIHGDPEEQAMKAWLTLQRAISEIGTYNSIFFEDPKMYAVIKFFGGWKEIGQWPVKYMDKRRDEFVDAYKSMKSPPPSQMIPGHSDTLSIQGGNPNLFGWAIVGKNGEFTKMRRLLAANGTDILDLPEPPPAPRLAPPPEEDSTELVPVSTFLPELMEKMNNGRS